MLVVIEGIDGAGKATCIAEVSKLLNSKGIAHRTVDFPRYGITKSSSLIADILNGTLSCENAYFSAVTFALDRFESISEVSNTNEIVLCDRYVTSNAAYQSAHVSEDEFETICDWVFDFEHNRLGMPMPNISILLDIDVDEARALVSKKQKRAYTDLDHDVYENNIEFQRRVANNYKIMASQKLGGSWAIIPVTKNNNLRSPNEIAEDVVKQILMSNKNG